MKLLLRLVGIRVIEGPEALRVTITRPWSERAAGRMLKKTADNVLKKPENREVVSVDFKDRRTLIVKFR